MGSKARALVSLVSLAVGACSSPLVPPGTPACAQLASHTVSAGGANGPDFVHGAMNVVSASATSSEATLTLDQDETTVSFDVFSAPDLPAPGTTVNIETTTAVDTGEGSEVGYVRVTDDTGVVVDGGRAYSRDAREVVNTIGVVSLDPTLVGDLCTTSHGTQAPMPTIFHVDGADVALAAGETKVAAIAGVPVLLVSNGGSDAVVDVPTTGCADCPYTGRHEIWSASGYAYRVAR